MTSPAATLETWVLWLREQGADLTFEFHSGPRGLVLVITGDGSLLVREYGGPIYYHGRLDSTRSKMVRCWHGQPNLDLHRRSMDALLDCGFAGGTPSYLCYCLVPDEVPSGITVRHRSGEQRSMSAPHRLIEAHAKLHAVETEWDRCLWSLSSQPQTELMPNPEFDSWSDEDVRRQGPVGP